MNDTILCGDKGIVVFIVNQDFDMTRKGFTSRSKEDVKVEINIPYGNVREALRIVDGEWLPVDRLEVQDEKASLEMGQLDIWEVIYLPLIP